jgi:hypothetical protein
MSFSADREDSTPSAGLVDRSGDVAEVSFLLVGAA